jgi:signal transduction histidine kinase
VESTDKRLWFLTLGGIFQIDPNHVLRNSTPPSVIIRSVGSGPRTNEDTGPAVFAAGTTNVQIAYTAPNLSVPERVRFRYKLEGSDHEWQDAGTRRQAFYTNLRPRHYRFQVTARNNDGDWNTVGASVDFTIEPAWYQTNWFLGLCIALGLFSAWSLYRIRVWQVERAITARFDERLSERTRMARELHDTFLQTIQGSKFVVDDGLEEPLDPEKMHRALGQVSGWLDQAITEGRAALNSLRASTTLKNELAPALRRAAESGVVPDGMTISVSVIGDIRELHPIVRDELYRIGNEAIQNAKAHSHGSVLAIDLSYGQDLAMHIRDNGVGIDPRYAMSGREGHHGLQGMRERASRIQGRLTILSSAESGTDISVIVPGSVSFLQLETGILADLRKLFLRAKRDRGAL